MGKSNIADYQKSMVKEAIKKSFNEMYNIASITVSIEQDVFNEYYKNIVAVIVEKDTNVTRLEFYSCYQTCYEYNYVADMALKNERKWMYKRFVRNLGRTEFNEIIERR